MSEQPRTPAKKPKGRSPAYPAISLETAIQRARQLYEKERRHPTRVVDIASHWDYKSLNGPAAQSIAALKKYGLLADEGTGEDRKAQLSDLADTILLHPDEATRRVAIQDAALRPAIHRELWEKYHEDLPSDRTLLWDLTRDRGFTETGASEFIREYRATIAFAQLGTYAPSQTPASEDETLEDDDMGDSDTSPPAQGPPSKQPRRQPTAETTQSYSIPLISGGVVVVEGEFPLSERDWDQFIAVLNAMKPGLVETPAEDEG
jgi:hypothetical protein